MTIMTSKIKILMSHTSNSGVSESKKAVVVIHIKSGNSDIKKAASHKKNENVAHSISERKFSENRN